MHGAADGTAVVSVGVTGDRADALLVTLRDGEVQDAHEVPGVATELAVDRAVQVAHLGHSRAEGGADVALAATAECPGEGSSRLTWLLG